MEDHVEKFRQADALAQNILRLTRNTLLVNLRFLDLALSQFQLTSYPGTCPVKVCASSQLVSQLCTCE